MHSMLKIRRFIHVSYSKNRDWKPVISQILTNVQEIFLVMWMLTVPTQLDHMYVHATLDTLETDKLAQVILITFLQCPEKSFMTEERQPPLLLFLYIQSQLLKAGGNLKRLFSLNYKAGYSQTFILKFIRHEKMWILLFCPPSFEIRFAVFWISIHYILIHQNIFHHNIQLWVVTWYTWSRSDIDECSQMNICDKNAACSNTQGSYSCACNPKYIGDGLNCKG